MTAKLFTSISRISILAICFLFLCNHSANAADIQIQFLGLNLQYNDDGVTADSGTYDIYDGTDYAGGTLDSDEADAIVFADLSVGTTPALTSLATYSDNIYVDFLFEDLEIPTAIGASNTSPVNTAAFGFDIWQQASSTSGSAIIWDLQLRFDQVTVTNAGGSIKINLAVGGASSSIAHQNLPFDLVVENLEITLAVITDGATTPPSSGGIFTDLTASGTGDIKGGIVSGPVPEPSTIVLALFGIVGLLVHSLRKRWQK